MVELRVLGGVDLRADDGRELHAFLAQPKRLALLAYLCIASPRGFHRRDALLGIFWPNADESHARNSLRNAVHVIRRALGDDALLVRGAEELAANRDVIACDACEFADAAQQGAVHEAVAGYRGDLLPGYFIEGAPAFERWLEEERARLRGIAVRAARLCADRLATSGNLSGAVRVARRGAELAEDDERVVRRLIELLAESGDRAGALHAYAAFARRLADEYDATPSAETELMARRLRTPIEDADVVAAQRQYTPALIAASAPAARNDPQPQAIPAFPSIPGYVLESELARGGTSTVYLARDRKHQRTVAIKILRADVAAVIGTSRFLTEINVAARLRHEHIVPLFDSGTAGELPYFVMPCIEGETLRERLHREQRLPMADALHIVRDVAEALDYAHAHGIIHGDIKPENILLAPGHALVADFGVAQALERAAGQELTKRAFVAGTPRYTSPEVASGAVSGDARSDVYSLACVLHEALGGAPPVAASEPRMYRAGSAKGPAAAMRAGRLDVPRALARVIQQALSIEPSERFATAGEFAARASAAGVRRSPFRSAGIAAGAALTLVAAVTLGVTLLGNTRHGGSTSGTSALVRRQLTFTGTPMLSALSEDGAYLAYSVPDGDSESVFVSDLAGGVARRLAVVSFVNSVEWSPDGTRVLVGADNRAIVVPRGGGSARTVPIPPRFEVAVHAYWLPDGGRISVHGNMSRRIVVIDLRSGDTVAIPLRDRFILFEGAWSPDGRAFAVATEDSTREQLRVLSMDGRATIVVDDTIGIASPRWSPAGDAIYYARGHESIWRVPVSLRTHVATGPPEEIHRFLEMLPNHDGHSVFSLAQHGLSMAYTRGLRFANLWSITGDDSGAPRPAQLTSGTARIGSPAVSPDGRTIAFVEAVEDSRELFRMPAGGGTPTRITFGAGVGSQGIAWSPDGRQIAFISTRAQRRPLIADAATGRLVDPGGQSEGWGAIAWAPGTRIAFQSRGNRNIVLLDPRTGREERLLPDDTSGWYFAPRYSPDGRRLAVNANLPGGDFGISIFDLTARSMARIRTPVMFPRGWSTDGRYVYAIGLRSIYRVDTQGSAPPELVLALPWREPDCAPARPQPPTFFICSASDYNSDVWVIENFRSRPEEPATLPSDAIGVPAQRNTTGSISGRVVVAPFLNETGHPALDTLGSRVAELIAHDLVRYGVAATVPAPPRSVAGPSLDQSTVRRGASREEALARETGAQFVVAGAFELSGDNLSIRALVFDAKSDVVRAVVGPLQAPMRKPAHAIDELRQKVLGVVSGIANPRNDGLLNMHGVIAHARSLEGQREFRLGLDLFLHSNDYRNAIAAFRRAYALDTTDAASLLQSSFVSWTVGEPASVDSIIGRLRQRRNGMSEHERLWFDLWDAKVHGNLDGALRASRELVAAMPGGGWELQGGYSAISAGRPGEAIELLSTARIDRGILEGLASVFELRAEALHLLGDHTGELAAARAGRKRHPSSLRLVASEAQALAASGRTPELRALLTESTALPIDEGFSPSLPPRGALDPATVMRIAASELSCHGYGVAARQLLDDAVPLARARLDRESRSESSLLALAEALYAAGSLPEARDTFERLASIHPGVIHYSARLGTIAAREGRVSEATAISAKLAARSGRYSYGANSMWRARIAALLGQSDDAAILFQQAVGEGYPLEIEVHRDIDLASLRDRPGVRDLLYGGAAAGSCVVQR